MKNKIHYLIILLLLLTGCAADEFEWKGTTVGADEYLIAFTNSAPQVDVVSATRATDADRDEIKELTLLVFSTGNNGKLLKTPIEFTPGSDNCKGPVVSGSGDKKTTTPGTIIIKKGDVADGDWYLVANAKDKIAACLTAKGNQVAKDEFLSFMSYDEDQLTGEGNDVQHVMVNNHEISLAGDQTSAEVFDLQRIYARVSVEINADKLPFVMTGARLTRYVKTGNLSMAVVSVVDNDAVSDTEGWTAPSEGQTWNKGITFTYAKKNEQILTATYPFAEAENAANNQKIMMLVKGYYNQSGDVNNPEYTDKALCYYAIPLPELQANHHLKVLINGASAMGKVHAQDAEDNPGGLSVEFKDATAQIHNIISDGENVLALPDTLHIDADKTNWTMDVMARKKGATGASVKLELRQIGTATVDWLTISNLNPAGSAENLDTEARNKGLFTTKVVVSGTSTVNEGSEREVSYKVTLEGTSLSRDVVIVQDANKNVKYSKVVQISLEISGHTKSGQNVTIDDYLGFINSAIVEDTPSIECRGIAPSANGGRVRNIGLHMPMPNGDATYTYHIKTIGKAEIYRIEQDGTQKNLTDINGREFNLPFKATDIPSGESNAYSYFVNTDKYIIKANGEEYTLDLYHTGFFNNESDGWHYYEVMTQDDNELYWLDRNLGATSAGMAVREGSSLLSSSGWPYAGAEATGGLYNFANAEANCPEGWGLPTYAQLRSLTVSANFSTNRMATVPDQKTYFAPSFIYKGKVDGRTQQIRSYFPANRFDNGGWAGDDGAGYYITQTPAGSENWYQIMQFTGMNVTSQNVSLASRKMSVRCCAGDFDPQTGSTRYVANVRGYTHVFMYHLNTVGTKTYLTTWPGEQIAVYNDKGRYHPFELTPAMEYDIKRIYVIFNIVDDSGKITSNVSDEKVTARDGIPFKNNRKYDLNAGSIADGATSGNWVTTSQDDDTPDYKYRIKGNFNDGDWNKGQVNFTYNSSTKLWECKNLSISLRSGDGQNEFVIQRALYTSSVYTDWGKADALHKSVILDTPMAVATDKGYDYNWQFTESGTYNLTFNEADMTLTVSKTSGGGGPDPVVTYKQYRIVWDWKDNGTECNYIYVWNFPAGTQYQKMNDSNWYNLENSKYYERSGNYNGNNANENSFMFRVPSTVAESTTIGFIITSNNNGEWPNRKDFTKQKLENFVTVGWTTEYKNLDVRGKRGDN